MWYVTEKYWLQVTSMKIKSRVVHLPMTFEDSATLDAIARYRQSVRDTAPWLPSNSEFIRRINGLDSVQQVRDIIYKVQFFFAYIQKRVYWNIFLRLRCTCCNSLQLRLAIWCSDWAMSIWALRARCRSIRVIVFLLPNTTRRVHTPPKEPSVSAASTCASMEWIRPVAIS